MAVVLLAAAAAETVVVAQRYCWLTLANERHAASEFERRQDSKYGQPLDNPTATGCVQPSRDQTGFPIVMSLATSSSMSAAAAASAAGLLGDKQAPRHRSKAGGSTTSRCPTQVARRTHFVSQAPGYP